jgi:uncharacterized protein YbaP (TraB family)
MKKFSFSLIILLAYLSNIVAQAPGPGENALLWRITGKGLTSPSYVYGTIHIIPTKDFFLSDSTLQAFNRAESVAFEFNLKKEMRILPQLRLMLKTRMRGDTTLGMLLSTEDYRFVQEKFRNKRIPMKIIERLKPMFIADLANQDFSGSGTEPMTSYEMEFLNRAKQQNKKVRGLETAGYQISVLDSIPYLLQAQMLVEEMRKGSKNNREYKRLVKIYKRQDLEMLGKMTLGADDFGSYNDILLYNRNRNWIPVMENFMQKNSMFFAVGAAHLLGDRGVISLLRKRGYLLTPIK